MFSDQAGSAIRCEWGLHGIRAFQEDCDVFVIVDVLSFCTAVNIAVENGALIYPCQGPAEACEALANEHNAVLARRGQGGFSLSPSSLLSIETDTRLVLPSPNGSRLSLATGSRSTLAGCLRNAEAVARAAQSLGSKIGVIPAGERWHYGEHNPLRPALEDWLGAGAIIHYLAGTKSPEASAAEALFIHFRPRLLDCLQGCSSGKELIEKGLAADVELAAALNSSQCVPILENSRYMNHARHKPFSG